MRPPRPSRALLLVGFLGLLSVSLRCSPPEGGAVADAGSEAAAPETPAERPGDPASSQRGILADLRRAAAAKRSASDGGGRAWIEETELPGGGTVPHAGGVGRWTILYEAGPEGIAKGGSVRFLASPYWEWSRAQNLQEDYPGYTKVESLADGVTLDVQYREWLVIGIRGRALAPGERIRIEYGAGQAGARVDGYAEREEHFWLAVDGDGDDTASVLAESPKVDVRPGPARRLNLELPSTAHPGDQVPLRIALLDVRGSTGCEFSGTVELASADEDAVELPEPIRLTAADEGRHTVMIGVKKAGVVRLAARAVPDGEEAQAGGSSDALIGQSNPLEVLESAPRILWGDLHGHSNFSDGTGTPEDYLRYARDVAGLDVIALTDHDHWGLRFLDENPAMWQRIQDAVKSFHDPGRFVTVLGYEWTNWVHGHRHVLYFQDQGPILSSIDPAYETPTQLWDALRASGAAVLTVAHHSAGGPIATNWDFAPDPELEPVTEVASVHGSSEAPDAPRPIYAAVAGNYVRDALDRGYRLGFIGSGDSHDGHPGLAQIASGQGGLAAILSEDVTREGVLAALRARRTYATNGPRIVLRCALGAHRMGEGFPAADVPGKQMLFVHAIACAALDHIDVVRSGKVVQTIDTEKAWNYTAATEVEDLQPGEYLYVRVVQEDGGAAWSSPFYLE